MEPMGYKDTSQRFSVGRVHGDHAFNPYEVLDIFTEVFHDSIGIPVDIKAKSLVKPHPNAHSCSNSYPRRAISAKYIASHLTRLLN